MTVDSGSHLAASSTALRFGRWPLAAIDAGAPALLGGHLIGTGDAGAPDWPILPCPLLSPAAPAFDAWLADGEIRRGRHGSLHYATNDEWLYGWAEIDELGLEGGLQAASHRIYAELFEALDASRTPQLLRLWNYIADINRDGDSLERYRHFNVGRQQAFLEAGRSAFDNAPAACALGTAPGPLRVYCLAGRQAPTVIENPRQVSAYRYPDQYGPRSPSFSRAALAEIGGGRCALFISGTASIVGHASMHVGDVRRQTEESLANIRAIREVAGARAQRRFDTGDLVYTVYVRHRADLAAVREVFERHVGADAAAARGAVYLQADICRADLLVEIEAHGFPAAEVER